MNADGTPDGPYTVEHYSPLTGQWHDEDGWTSDKETALRLVVGYHLMGYEARLINTEES